MHRDAQRLAEAAGQTMSARDRASIALGIRLVEVRPGYACLRMPVRDDMLNFVGTVHGGVLFTLADTAFGFACNSHNRVSVASSCSIEFLRPALAGETLTATAVEQSLIGRNGIYDVRVENNQGELVALFRGKSAQIKGTVTDEPPGAGRGDA